MFNVDNDIVMLCSIPLTIIVRLVFKIKINPAMNSMFINTVYQLIVPYMFKVFISCYIIGHFESIIVNIIIFSWLHTSN